MLIPKAVALEHRLNTKSHPHAKGIVLPTETSVHSMNIEHSPSGLYMRGLQQCDAGKMHRNM